MKQKNQVKYNKANEFLLRGESCSFPCPVLLSSLFPPPPYHVIYGRHLGSPLFKFAFNSLRVLWFPVQVREGWKLKENNKPSLTRSEICLLRKVPRLLKI